MAETESLLVLMTETVPSPEFATYALAPFGVTAIPRGALPTVIVETESLLVSITETVVPP